MGKRILVVDDDLYLQKFYKVELEDESYEVLLASSGLQALEILEEGAILDNLVDLVILDISMPGMDGIEVLKRIKDGYPYLPVIMHTSFDYFEDFAVWAANVCLEKQGNVSELKTYEPLAKLLNERSFSSPYDKISFPNLNR